MDESLIEELEAEIGFEEQREISGEWTKDYHEGYIDGLRQAVVMAKE